MGNRRQTSTAELGHLTDSPAYQVPGDATRWSGEAVVSQEPMTRSEEHRPREGLCLVLWQPLPLGNDGEILISENTFHKKDRVYICNEEDAERKEATCTQALRLTAFLSGGHKEQ